MARLLNKLTEKAIDKAKPRAVPYLMADGAGLAILVEPSGRKYWRWRYRWGGTQRTLSVGVWPEIGRETARDRRDDLRKLAGSGTDPSMERKRLEAEKRRASAGSFKAVAEKWLAKRKCSASTRDADRARLVAYVYKAFGNVPMPDVGHVEIESVLEPLEAKLAPTAAKVRTLLSAIFKYAINRKLAAHNPAAEYELEAVTSGGFPGLTVPAKVGELLRRIETYSGEPVTMAALRLAPLLFVRPGELHAMEWGELDLDGEHPEWHIPSSKMKEGREHVVPLSSQAVAILRELHKLTGHQQFVFWSPRTDSKRISEGTINKALRKLKYNTKTEHCGHGFRKTASTLLNARGYDERHIEMQLAHVVGGVKGTYNKAKYLPERRAMMRAWGDYLDGLRADDAGKVVAIGSKGAA